MSSPASRATSRGEGRGPRWKDRACSIHLGSLPLAWLSPCSAGNDIRGLAAGLVRFCLQLNKILNTHLFDQAHLGLQPVDMLFLALQNIGKELAADEILDRLAMADRQFEVGQGH